MSDKIDELVHDIEMMEDLEQQVNALRNSITERLVEYGMTHFFTVNWRKLRVHAKSGII